MWKNHSEVLNPSEDVLPEKESTTLFSSQGSEISYSMKVARQITIEGNSKTLSHQ